MATDLKYLEGRYPQCRQCMEDIVHCHQRCYVDEEPTHIDCIKDMDITFDEVAGAEVIMETLYIATKGVSA